MALEPGLQALTSASPRRTASSDSSRSFTFSFPWFRRARNLVDGGDGLADGQLLVDEALLLTTLYGPAGRIAFEDLACVENVGSAILAEKAQCENMRGGSRGRSH